MTVKQNCWEFKRCGRELGGVNVYKLGLCPATKEPRLHGVHGGEQAGRACWIVAGTFCGGKIEGTFAQKYKTCKDCDFYKKVLEEDSDHFELSMNLAKRLK